MRRAFMPLARLWARGAPATAGGGTPPLGALAAALPSLQAPHAEIRNAAGDVLHAVRYMTGQRRRVAAYASKAAPCAVLEAPLEEAQQPGMRAAWSGGGDAAAADAADAGHSEAPGAGVAGSTAVRPALAPLPAPNLGYAADNVTLQRSHRVTTSRSCHRRTYDEKGLRHVSRLALQNCVDLLAVVHWNHANGVRLFRVSSKLFPWSGQYRLEELPDYEAIAAALAAAGQAARGYGQRLTSHPPHFVKLASLDESIAARSAGWLEVHAQVFDLMGFPPSHWNKINIHVGGVYGSKPRTLARFARAFDALSASTRARLAVENDDRAGSYSVADLLPLHASTSIPITFDFHHHAFCTGGQSREEALGAAVATWPPGVRPVVHWSEPPECPAKRARHPYAHSAFVYGPIDLHGREGAVDVMIESKAKEVALLLYRDELAPRMRAEATAALQQALRFAVAAEPGAAAEAFLVI